MLLEAKTTAWRGRANHASSSSGWLLRTKQLCSRWPKTGLSDRALVALLEALPALARQQGDGFEANVRLLEAQSSDPAWQKAVRARLALVERAAMQPARSRGDAIALMPRRDSWRAHLDDNSQWQLHDGRALSQFLRVGSSARRVAWQSASTLPRLEAIEMPTKHLEGFVWAEAFDETARWLTCGHPNIQAALESAPAWRLAIRRIRSVGLRGLFDPSTQTVIVDPRHPDTLKHELAHWALGHTAGVGARQAEVEVDALLAETAILMDRPQTKPTTKPEAMWTRTS